MAWFVGIMLVIAAYLLGSIPTGYLVARAVKGIDIREHGSGNTGATNVLRVVGKRAGFTVLAIDVLKGCSSVLLVRAVLSAFYANSPDWQAALPWWITIASLFAMLGHSRSIWLNWTGGKSAATGLGVLLALAWPVGIGTAGMFAFTLAFSRIVSLSSIVAVLSAVILMVITQQPIPYILLAIAGGFYIVLRHRTNIQRIFSGTEPRLGSHPTAKENPDFS